MSHNVPDQEGVDREGEVWQELIYTGSASGCGMGYYENDEVGTILVCNLLVLDLQIERVRALA